MTIDTAGKVTVNSFIVNSIDYNTFGKSFSVYSKESIANGLAKFADTFLGERGFSTEEIERMKPAIVTTYMDFWRCDESPNEQSSSQIDEFTVNVNPIARVLAAYFRSMQNDLPPADNDVIVNIKIGDTR